MQITIYLFFLLFFIGFCANLIGGGPIRTSTPDDTEELDEPPLPSTIVAGAFSGWTFSSFIFYII